MVQRKIEIEVKLNGDAIALSILTSLVSFLLFLIRMEVVNNVRDTEVRETYCTARTPAADGLPYVSSEPRDTD